MLNTALSVLVAAMWVAPLAAVQAPRPVTVGPPVSVTAPTPSVGQGGHGAPGGSGRPVVIQGDYRQSRPVVVAPQTYYAQPVYAQPVYNQPRYVYQPAPVWVEGTWQWSPYGWVWQAGYWSQPVAPVAVCAPAPVCAPPPRCGASFQFTWGR